MKFAEQSCLSGTVDSVPLTGVLLLTGPNRVALKKYFLSLGQFSVDPGDGCDVVKIAVDLQQVVKPLSPLSCPFLLLNVWMQ